MFEKSSKRFEKLESSASAAFYKEDLRVSRRFDCLEVGERKIEVAITDKIISQEQIATSGDIVYSVLCPYCGGENKSDVLDCIYCKHSLRTVLSDKYQKIIDSMHKCSGCGAANLGERNNCWFCGKNLTKKCSPQAQNENMIILNIDGKEYRSTDADLPFEIRFLMERIRKEGYKKEIIDAWVKERNTQNEQNMATIDSQLLGVQTSLILRGIGLVVFLIFIIFQLNSCFRVLGIR